jgi:glycosyltransferase involved in cell wall biosynthesis
MKESIATNRSSLPLHHKTDWPRRACRVVIVAPFPPPLGGMAVQAEQLKNLLESNGVPVTAISTTWKLKGFWGFFEALPGIRTILHLIRFITRIYSIASSKTIFHVFSNSFASFFLWTLPTVVVCKWRRAPVIINYRGGHAQKFLQRWKKFAEPVFRQASRIVVPSQFLEFVFLQHDLSTEVIPNIIADGLKPKSKPANHKTHVMVNRNFEPIYNVACAIRAFVIIQAIHPKSKLTLIGDGSERARLERLVSALGLRNVTFTGQLANQKVIELLGAADLLLNPTNVDNMPISLLEAMAIGIPIVSTNAGGVPYLIENKVTGILVEKNDHQAMARAALRILRSMRLQKRLKHHAWKQARKCSWQNVWPQWSALYLSLLNK